MAVVALLVGVALRGPAAEARAMGELVRPFAIVAVVVLGGGRLARTAPARAALQRLSSSVTTVTGACVLVLVVTAVCSALLNLDVAVVVAMPLALVVAGSSGLDAGWLAIAVAAVANGASILLPTSNLTNLLIAGPVGVGAYVSTVWLAWLLVCVVSIASLTLVLRRTASASRPSRARADLLAVRWSPVGVLVDLSAMLVLATAVRALLPAGIALPGGFAENLGAGSLLAAGANNLPAAAAMGAGAAIGPWAGILAAAIGPNLLITGSVATIVCRRIARDHGADLSPRWFTFVGLALVPLQLVAGSIGLALRGAI